MRVQGFIFSWPGYEARAALLERVLGRAVDVRVIHSGGRPSAARPRWVHLARDAYFSAQWNHARVLFEGDVLFHIQADAVLDRPTFERLRARALRIMERHRAAVYEPHVDYSAYRYDLRRLVRLERQVYEVPLTDCTCWFIAEDVLRRVPPVDLAVNRYGWGIAATVAAVARGQGRRCVRDYRFTVRHPRGRGYSSEDAARQRASYVRGLPRALARGVLRAYEGLWEAASD